MSHAHAHLALRCRYWPGPFALCMWISALFSAVCWARPATAAPAAPGRMPSPPHIWDRKFLLRRGRVPSKMQFHFAAFARSAGRWDAMHRARRHGALPGASVAELPRSRAVFAIIRADGPLPPLAAVGSASLVAKLQSKPAGRTLAGIIEQSWARVASCRRERPPFPDTRVKLACMCACMNAHKCTCTHIPCILNVCDIHICACICIHTHNDTHAQISTVCFTSAFEKAFLGSGRGSGVLLRRGCGE